MWSYIFCTIAVLLHNVHADRPPKATLPNGGVLVGGYMTTMNGNSVKAFRGIPYAEPPIGSLRFMSPVPAKAWTGEKIVDKDPAICWQLNPVARNFTETGSNNCLYLNVYIPEKSTGELSVMVYFHEGGWLMGSGNSDMHGPEKLLDNNVILVIGNYRLGALGFLSSGTKDLPGNYGMKDQVLVLRWVKENIAAFGGNPNDVTIFGESVGGASVGFHIYSPLSKGLFHKAIMESGSNFALWALGDISVVRNRTLTIAKHLECPTDIKDDNWKPLVECLMSKPAKEIASVIKPILKYDIDPAIPFPVVVEPESDEAFLTNCPSEISSPPSANVPVIIGINSGDGILKSGPILHNILDDFKSKFEEVLPVYLYIDHKPEKLQKEWIRRIDQFYFKGKHDWTKTNHENLTNLFTDSYFTDGLDKFVRHRFEAAKTTTVGPTFVYYFDHKGSKSMSSWFLSGPEYYGVSHMDELAYLFDFKLPAGNENDNKMKWAMPTMWTNFAKTGNPTPKDGKIEVWKPADKFPLQYAHIGRPTDKDWKLLSNEIGLLEDRVKFWRELERIKE